MGKYDKPDNQIDGQMSIEDLFEPPEKVFAVSRIFARARKSMNLAEQKTFVYALTHFKFTEEAQSNVVYLDKKVLAKIIGIDSDIDHLGENMKRCLRSLRVNSEIEFSKADKDYYEDGALITNVRMYRNIVRIEFYNSYLKLFTGLTLENPNFITMWSSDIFQMNSKRSVQFYEYLRQITDTRKSDHSVLLGVKAIKEMFDIPEKGKGSYMREKGFNRTEFEKKVIQPICDDLKNCKMIQLAVHPDGKLYEKVRSGKRVIGYRFYWTYSAYPAIATASEVKELQERVDKDPAVLKVAKDIVKGEKKPKKKTKKDTSFTDFEQRDYDYTDLERQLLQQQVKKS